MYEIFKFWGEYLEAHKHLSTRIIHVLGTLIGIAIIVVSIISERYWGLILAPVTSYAFAWNAHFWIEKNTPETFKHPIMSLLCDLYLCWLLLTFRNP